MQTLRWKYAGFSVFKHGTTKDDAGKIDNMFVKLGKIGVHLRFREKSGVWAHFGELLVSLGETYLQ